MAGFGISPAAQVRLSEVIAALSYALDITEGQPKGHAARSCMLGMRLARDLRLGAAENSALFYALLLKDLGCSSNAGKMCYLFGTDDRTVKQNIKTVNWTSKLSGLKYALRTVGIGESLLTKMKHFTRVAVGGDAQARELIHLRCERGATIARQLQFPELTADAIRSLDEHYDGCGHPDGLAGDKIPLLARVLSIAQTAEVFIRELGLPAACDMARQRSGTWFDPQLVKLFLSLARDQTFWKAFYSEEPIAGSTQFEPPDSGMLADEARLDRIAQGFSEVIDAKSPWTFRHSEGVADISAGLASVMGFSEREVRYIRRAALVHDIGKLGISNLILDKPGKLTPAEMDEMRRHPLYSFQILSRVEGFKDLADLAASHHERIDGKGYHRGLTGDQLSTPARIIAVADMYEALSADRPYRPNLSRERVLEILKANSGSGICPTVYEALNIYLGQVDRSPRLAA